MKSVSSLLGKSLRQVRSRSRVLLSGTPVQNALQDLWALMDFAQPGLLGNHATFVKHFSDPIDRGSLRGATAFDVELKKHLSEQLRNLIAPHLFRRTKANVGLVAEEGLAEVNLESKGSVEHADDDAEDGEMKKLIPKIETIVWLAPSAEQIDIYQKALEMSDVIREAASKQKLGIEVFRAIGMLKRLCNHPMLARPLPSPDAWTELLSEAQDNVNKSESEDFVLPEMTDGQGGADDDEMDETPGATVELALSKLPRDNAAILSQSAKLKCLSALLPALAAKGHRTLVFSQSVKMLDLIQLCVLRPHGLRSLRIDGKTDAQSRIEKVRKFEAHPDRFQCMLLTTSTGGVGLNLTSADRVVLVDPAWNPATDAQAVDRAFRIGQQREVRVYRLIMSGLIEDKMFRLQVFKMSLTKTALEGEQGQRYFTEREIRSLFEWTDPAEGETRKMLLENHGPDSERLVRHAAEDDGSVECGWFQAGPAVGLSDFSALFKASGRSEGEEHDDDGDDVTGAQVAEAKGQLGAADERAQHTGELRQAAENEQDSLKTNLDEVLSKINQAQAQRAKVDEDFKERRSELTIARRAESDAQRRLEKAMRARAYAQDQSQKAVQASSFAEDAVGRALRTEVDTLGLLRSAEQALPKVLAEVEAIFAVIVDEAATTSRKQRALESARQAIDKVFSTQSQLEQAESGLANVIAAAAEAAKVAVESGELSAEEALQKCEEEAQEALKAQRNVQRLAEAAFGAASASTLELSEAGVDFAGGLVANTRSRGRPGAASTGTPSMSMQQVKNSQATIKMTLRQLSTAWTACLKMQDTWEKTVGSRRKVVQKAVGSSLSCAEGQVRDSKAESEYTEAIADEERCRSERAALESDATAADAARSTAELEESDLKRRRDELKAGLAGAKDAVKSARAKEKEAEVGRQAMITAFSKVERAKMQLETAKTSAVEFLQTEEYDANQVTEAWQAQVAKKRSGLDAGENIP